MADVISLAQRVSSVDVSPKFQPYSKVIIHIDNDNAVEVGDNTGRTLEFDNPFGSEAMARNILNRLSGYQYQPYQADGALLDPAAEIGDAISTATSYGGLYTRSRKFGRLMKADISAPHDEEINHEFKYESPQERKFTRVTGEIKASIIITNNMIQSEVAERKAQDDELSSQLTQTADGIRASVVAKTGGATSSFGWNLDASSHKWYANGQEVMRVSASGLMVKGEIQATTGKIGGFDIGTNALSYNGLTWGDTSRNYGAYIGQSGIQLGKNFKVDNGGNVTASNMTLSGTLMVGGSYITSEALRSGAQSAYDSGSYWSGGASGGYSYTAAAASNSGSFPAGFTCGVLWAKYGISVSGRGAGWKHVTISGVTINYLGY